MPPNEAIAAAGGGPAMGAPAPHFRTRKLSTLTEKLIGAMLLACALVSIVTTAGILFVLLYEAVAFFSEVSFVEFLGDTEWTPLFADKHFGIWPLVAGTALTSFIAMVVALPTGLLAAIYLSEYAPERVRRVLKPALEILAGIPTIVYGFFALVVVTPALQHIIPGLNGFNALSAGLVMGIMIMPMISSLSEDALYSVPNSLREAAFGLGSTQMSSVVRVVVPAASSGIIASVILAVSRAVGETMIVVVAAGQNPNMTLDPREMVQTMTAFIVQISMGDVQHGSLEYRTIFAVGTALFVITFVMNLLAQRIARHYRGRS